MTNAAQMIADSYVDAAGNRRWRANDQIPPSDCLKAMGVTGAELACMEAVRDAELDAFLEAYRAEQAKLPEPSPEHVAELRAVHGSGKRIINVVTGRITHT